MVPNPIEILNPIIGTLNDCSICIIDISNNKDTSTYQELLECPICLDPIILEDPLLTLNCCKNKVHLKCVCEWYHNNLSNIKCFMCNQTNPFGDQTIQPQYLNSSNRFVVMSSQTPITENIRLRHHIIQQQNRESREQCNTAIRMLIVAFVTGAIVIFIIVISITN